MRKRDSFTKVFFRIFKTFEHHFLSEHFQKSDCNGIFRVAVNCRLVVLQFHLNGFALHTFFWVFSKFFFCRYFKTWKHLWQSLVLFWAVDYQIIFYLKNDFTWDNFFKSLEMSLSPQKSLWWTHIQVATYNIPKSRPYLLM